MKFYIELLTKVTKENLHDFCNNKKREKINVYCLVNNIYSLEEYKENTSTWISNELSNLISDEKHDLAGNPLDSYFSIDLSEEYFCFIVFYYLEDCFKLNGVAHYELLTKLIEYLEVKQSYSVPHNQKETDPNLKEFNFLKELDKIWEFCKENFKDTYKDILDKKGNWKDINRLTLYQYYIFTELIQKNKDIIADNTITIKKFIDNCKSIGDIEKDYNNSKFPEIYFKWKQQLGNGANQVLSNLIGFISEKDEPAVATEKKDKLETFEKNQKFTILNSEIVEKNDGKASYILKRLFKAFIANSHQLPDEYLRNILFNLIDHYDNLIDEDEKCFKLIINKLGKTMPGLSGDDITQKVLSLNFSRIPNNDNNEGDNYKDVKYELSNEIVALSDKRIDLYKFFVSIKDNKKLISQRKAIISECPELKKHLKLFRRIIDNPTLNANSLWKSILTRGICDYIASLTDQEAIDEYEKLYAGVMEIV